MPVSVLIDGFLGVHDVYLSLPTVIGRKGIQRVLFPPLNEDEEASFRNASNRYG